MGALGETLGDGSRESLRPGEVGQGKNREVGRQQQHSTDGLVLVF